MTKKQPARYLVAAILASAIATTPLCAQTLGNVNGVVVTDAGSAISGVVVRATDLIDGSKVFFAKSGADGAFALDGMAVGSYVVAAETINTQWVQRHDSPVVKVTTEPATVKLVLVSLAELQGEGGITPIQIATLAAGIGGLAAGIIAVKESQESTDESTAARRAAQANQQTLTDIIDRMNELQEDLSDNTRSLADLEAIAQEQQAALDALRDLSIRGLLENRDLMEQLRLLQRDIDEILQSLGR